MNSTAIQAKTIPAGKWLVDKTHATATFRVRHLELSDFAGQFEDVGAELTVGDDGRLQLSGYVTVDSCAGIYCRPSSST
jgi:polyisoprenoid-binding protein YceI